MDTTNPWRHARKTELKNMISTATREWSKALKAGDTSKAARIQERIQPVAEALDGME